MGFGDYLKSVFNNSSNDIGSAYNWLASNKGNSNAQTDRDTINPYLQQGNPYVGAQSPQAGNYGALVNMLMQRAQGGGPSIAGDAYNQAAADQQGRLLTMSHGGSPGAARAAVQQMGNIGQGLSQGYASARNQEMVGATGQLTGAINSADASQLNRDKANQEAWLQMLMQRLGLTRGEMSGKTNMDILGGIGQGVGQAMAAGG